jgi:ATP-binding cassette, subfamily C (CFTR/MRP), member 1
MNGKERDDNRLTSYAEQRQTGKPRETISDDLIASVSGTFSWKDDAANVLDIDNWKVNRGAFSLVLGPVGCGKSTMLKVLLGELSSFKGKILTSYSGVSYCSQTPWLPNETVRTVITGTAAFDEAWYSTVLRACALEPDLQAWPSGDGTLAGTKGISMSGGQKQRLVCRGKHPNHTNADSFANHY